MQWVSPGARRRLRMRQYQRDAADRQGDAYVSGPRLPTHVENRRSRRHEPGDSDETDIHMLRSPMRRFVLVLALVAAACSHAPVNSKLRTTPFDSTYGYRYTNIAPRNDNAFVDDTFVIVTMSGGGTRAAAFAYGVLQKLAETKIHHDTSDMLASIDVISSVSGGSFLSTYYALNGRQGLPTFQENFLKPNVEK